MDGQNTYTISFDKVQTVTKRLSMLNVECSLNRLSARKLLQYQDSNNAPVGWTLRFAEYLGSLFMGAIVIGRIFLYTFGCTGSQAVYYIISPMKDDNPSPVPHRRTSKL